MFESIAAFWAEYGNVLTDGVWDTLVMVVISTAFAYLIGLPLGVALILTQPHGIRPHRGVYRVLDWIVNIGRSVPFIILMVAIMPFTRMVVGTTIGGVNVYHVDQLEEYLSAHKVSVGLLTLPQRAAQGVADRLVAGGVRGIWNFTNREISVSRPDVAVENVHFSDSLLTLSYLIKVLKARGVRSIRLCTLLSKPERHKVEVPVDYLGFEIPDEFVVGYGLDYAEKYRNLPYIGILKPEVYGG